MRNLMLLAAALTLSTTLPTFAQSELDRLEIATEAASQNMETFLVGRVPELADVMVDWEWDEEMRAAAVCTLDAIRAEAGDEAVADYLDAMHTFATTEITSMEQMGTATPIPVNADFAMRTGTECGSLELSMRRMQDSGMMDAMMNPDIMGRLLAE